jgi:NAD(P)-dependent dehydrogenase (short-subunit alcohol dehydrogenase family)
MARVFITGSSDGLGLMAAKLLIEQRHDVVLHGRNDSVVAMRLRQRQAPRTPFWATSPPSLARRPLQKGSTALVASTP